jgi:hypothetical protein
MKNNLLILTILSSIFLQAQEKKIEEPNNIIVTGCITEEDANELAQYISQKIKEKNITNLQSKQVLQLINQINKNTPFRKLLIFVTKENDQQKEQLIIEVQDEYLLKDLSIQFNRFGLNILLKPDIESCLNKFNLVEGLKYSISEINNIYKALSSYLKALYGPSLEINFDYQIEEEGSVPNISLVFFIKDLYKTRLENIAVFGNKQISSKEINQYIRSKFNNSEYLYGIAPPIYNDVNYKFIVKNLNELYQNKGFIDFKVEVIKVILSEDKRRAILSIRVSEGERYTINEVKIRFKNQLDKDTMSLIEKERNDIEYFLKGKFYNKDKTNYYITENLADILTNNGYCLKNPQQTITFDKQGNFVNIFCDFNNLKQNPIVRNINCNSNGDSFTYIKDLIRGTIDRKTGRLNTARHVKNIQAVSNSPSIRSTGKPVEVFYTEHEDGSISINYNIQRISSGMISLQGSIGKNFQPQGLFTYARNDLLRQDYVSGVGIKFNSFDDLILSLSNSNQYTSLQYNFANQISPDNEKKVTSNSLALINKINLSKLFNIELKGIISISENNYDKINFSLFGIDLADIESAKLLKKSDIEKIIPFGLGNNGFFKDKIIIDTKPYKALQVISKLGSEFKKSIGSLNKNGSMINFDLGLETNIVSSIRDDKKKDDRFYQSSLTYFTVTPSFSYVFAINNIAKVKIFTQYSYNFDLYNENYFFDSQYVSLRYGQSLSMIGKKSKIGNKFFLKGDRDEKNKIIAADYSIVLGSEILFPLLTSNIREWQQDTPYIKIYSNFYYAGLSKVDQFITRINKFSYAKFLDSKSSISKSFGNLFNSDNQKVTDISSYERDSFYTNIGIELNISIAEIKSVITIGYSFVFFCEENDQDDAFYFGIKSLI